MATTHCSVRFTDSESIVHTARVQAESLYEAVALAVAEFRQDELVPSPTPSTEFVIVVERPPVEHRIRLNQVSKWAERTTRDGPAGITKREKVRTLLGQLAR
jgi:hypothetical protein